MSLDILTYALAKRYTNETVNGLGALKGAPCEIAAITQTSEGSIVTFKWTGADGAEQTQDLLIPSGLNEVERNELEVELQSYIDEAVKEAEPESIDDGEI